MSSEDIITYPEFKAYPCRCEYKSPWKRDESDERDCKQWAINNQKSVNESWAPLIEKSEKRRNALLKLNERALYDLGSTVVKIFQYEETKLVKLKEGKDKHITEAWRLF